MTVIVNGKLIMGILLLASGLVIFNFPDILQYALAFILSVSGIAAIIGWFRDRSTQSGAHFIRKEQE
ncbi:MAG: hypothetical protein AAEJ04_05690 [Planctomycetota bacterium]